MAYQIEVSQIVHGYTPPLHVVVEIADRLLGSDIILVVVRWSATRTHTDHVDKNDTEIFTELFDYFEEESA